MAHNFQTSTLSLTLPISCQICLGKVRQPVICANYHVFCSTCMETWLKKARQCPSCRVPITAENPCREIIGGTNESDHSGSHSMRKCLRKTRGELLLREYEDEIESLLTENEELKTKNQSLESQLKTVLDPSSIIVSKSEDKIVDPNFLKELTSKLQAATDVCSKVQQDTEKLKEANKTLRSQNVDLVQENMRLKAEVTSRSPQKFGRYTVAALESKIQQYERDMDHLKRALERSDQYIEDLESQLCDGRRATQPNALVALVSDKAGTDDPIDQQQINMLQRSLSDTERESICSNPEVEVSRTQGLMFTSTALLSDHTGVGERPPRQQNDKESNTASSQFSPSTPSSAFRSLALKSPRIREKKVAFRCASYLRRLSFEDSPNPTNCSTSSSSSCCSSIISTPEKQVSSVCDFPKGLSLSAQADPSTSVLWGAWQSSKSNDEPCPGPSKELSPRFKEAMSSDVVDMQPDSYQMTSEASMDAAYLDKISELDSMMLDGESSSSRGSQLSLTSSPSTDLDNTLVPDPHAPCDMLTGCDVEGGAELEDNLTLSSPRNQPPCDIDGPPVADTKAFSAEESTDSAEESAGIPVSASEGGAQGHSCTEHQMPSHTDELSFDLLFDSLEDEASPSDTQSATDDHRGDPHGSLSSSLADKPGSTRDRQTFVSGQPTKRKSHSPFNANSPTKLSKLVKLVILQPSNP